jgi:hypothetical protein
MNFADGRHECYDLYPVHLLEVFLGNSARSNSSCTGKDSVCSLARVRFRSDTDSFTCTASTSPTAGLDAVFLQVSIVGVTWPRVEISLGIVVGPLILILH